MAYRLCKRAIEESYDPYSEPMIEATFESKDIAEQTAVLMSFFDKKNLYFVKESY